MSVASSTILAGVVLSTELQHVLWFIVASVVGLALAQWLRGDGDDLDT